MSKNKIKKLAELENIVKAFKRKNKTIVFTNGCFDILHYGHTRYLEEAKTKGDILIVAVNSDASVKKIKGNSRPINPQYERACVIAALESVDYVTIFNQQTPLETIKKIRPDVLIKGSDWKNTNIVGSDLVKSYGGKVIRAKYIKDRSTTKLIEKIGKTNNQR